MDKKMDMTIATPEGVVFQGKVESVRFPGAKGNFMVLPMHAPLISLLESGTIVYTCEGKSTEITIRSGFVEINKDVVSACVELQCK